MEIINEAKISNLLVKHSKPSSEEINEVIDEAKKARGLTLEQAAILINISKQEDLEKLFAAANEVKELIYGKRVVLFAPLYLSNYCTNNCLYCGFRVANKEIHRSVLTTEDIKMEVLEILRQGHKRVLLLMGEHHKKMSLEKFIEAIKTVYSVKDEKGSSIRRINVEIEPLSEEEFKLLSEVPIGTYTVFQETYHRQTYKEVHLSGKKADYDWRLQVMDRALSNGMRDVGIGALFGLYDYRFEVLGLISHSFYLEEKYGIGPHTISIPRIRHAENAPLSEAIPHSVNDTDFRKLVAVLRLSVPYTGMILSTRETIELRMELLNLGISQISAGSRTNPGGYKQAADNSPDAQFNLNDTRTSGEVIKDVIKQGFIPSFCTSCYRRGRVGKDFMDQAKPGLIKQFCQPNGLFTLKEYLIDYADEETKEIGDILIEKNIESLPENIREKSRQVLDSIGTGQRDIYF